MTATPLPEPWSSLAREWAPRLIAAWSLDGLSLPGGLGLPGGTLRLMGLPPRPHVADGTAYFALGPLVLTTTHPATLDFLAGDPVDLGTASVSFPDPWPDVSGIPGGLRLAWRTPGLVHGLLARTLGVRLAEIRLYPRSALLILENCPDKTLTW